MKNIFDESLGIISDYIKDACSIDEENDLFKIEKTLELGKLYKELNDKFKELILLARYNRWSWKLDIEIKDIEKKINELLIDQK